jgi:hypothetical protein
MTVMQEPFDLPPETPLLVVVNPQGTPGQPSEKVNRASAFQTAFGALRGKLSSSDEFLARKTNVGFGYAQPTGSAQLSGCVQSTGSVQLIRFIQSPKSKQTVP